MLNFGYPIYLIMLQDYTVEPNIFPFFITIGVFNSFRVFVQHIVTMYDFEVVDIGECYWKTFCMPTTSLQKAMLFYKAVFFASIGAAIHCTDSCKRRLLMKQPQMDNLL